MTKTKAELLEELNDAKTQIKDLQDQLREAEQLERARTEATRAGREVKAAMDGFVEAGLTEAQAWELITTAIKSQGGCLQ